MIIDLAPALSAAGTEAGFVAGVGEVVRAGPGAGVGRPTLDGRRSGISRCYASRDTPGPRGGILGTVSHPSLGLPPRSLQAGFPDAAVRLRANRALLAVRALEIAVAADPTIRTRNDDTWLRNLLRDAEVHLDRLALCVAGNDPYWLAHFAENAATVFRRRGVPMDDVVQLLEGLRSAVRGVLSAEEMVTADHALDEAVAVYHWFRRLSGDARKKNPIIDAIYKGI